MMQLAVEVPAPEIQKFFQLGKARRQVKILPDIALQERRMIGQAVEDLGCGEPEIVQLTGKVGISHTSHFPEQWLKKRKRRH